MIKTYFKNLEKVKLHDLKHQRDQDDNDDSAVEKVRARNRNNKKSQRMRQMRRLKMEEKVMSNNSYRFLQNKFNKMDGSDIM